MKKKEFWVPFIIALIMVTITNLLQPVVQKNFPHETVLFYILEVIITIIICSLVAKYISKKNK